MVAESHKKKVLMSLIGLSNLGLEIKSEDIAYALQCNNSSIDEVTLALSSRYIESDEMQQTFLAEAKAFEGIINILSWDTLKRHYPKDVNAVESQIK